MPDIRAGSPTQPIGQWKMQPVSAAVATATGLGRCLSTTIAAALTAGNGVVITPASMGNIIVGKWLSIVNGATQEFVQVLAVTATTFTVNLVNSYGVSSNLYSVDGLWFGGIEVNQPGTGVTITLYNGLPGMLPKAGQAVAAIQPSGVGLIEWDGTNFDQGLFYTVAGGTVGNYTLLFLDHPPRI
jgi:hypothetical protein